MIGKLLLVWQLLAAVEAQLGSDVGVSLGCFGNETSLADLPLRAFGNYSDPSDCFEACFELDYLLFAVSRPEPFCFCANSVGRYQAFSDDIDCLSECFDPACTNSSWRLPFGRIFRVAFQCPAELGVGQAFECLVQSTSMIQDADLVYRIDFGSNSSLFNFSTLSPSFYVSSRGYSTPGAHQVVVWLANHTRYRSSVSINVWTAPFQFGSASIPFRLQNTTVAFKASQPRVLLPSLDANYSSLFLLTNSAIGVDGRLRFLEFYASKPGSIEISLARIRNCGDGCRDALNASTLELSSNNLEQLNRRQFGLTSQGYTLLPYDFLVRRGMLFLVKYLADSSGNVSLLVDGDNASYPDYQLNRGFSLSRLVDDANSSSSSSFYFRASVQDGPLDLSLVCDRSEPISVNQTVTCVLNTTTTTNASQFVRVDFDDGSSKLIAINGSTKAFSVGTNGSQRSLFESKFRNNFFYQNLYSTDGLFLMINTELSSGAYLRGFAIDAFAPGNVVIQFVRFPFCGEAISCREAIRTRPTVWDWSRYQVQYEAHFKLVVGFQRLYLPAPFYLERGSVALFDQLVGHAAVISIPALASDYLLEGPSVTDLVAVAQRDPTYVQDFPALQLNFTVLLETDAFFNSTVIKKTFSQGGRFTIRASYMGYEASVVAATQKVSVYGLWNEWEPWSACLFKVTRFNQTDNTTKMIGPNPVDCQLPTLLGSEDAQNLTNAISLNTQNQLGQISTNTRAAVDELDRKMAAVDSFDSTAATVAIILIVLFFLFFVAIDVLNLLGSLFGLRSARKKPTKRNSAKPVKKKPACNRVSPGSASIRSLPPPPVDVRHFVFKPRRARPLHRPDDSVCELVLC